MKFTNENSFLVLTIVFALFSASTSAPKPWVLDLTKVIDVHVASEPVSDLDVTQTIDLNYEVLRSIEIELKELGFTLISCRTDFNCYDYTSRGVCLDATLEIESILHVHLSSHRRLCTVTQTIERDVVLEGLPSIEIKLSDLLFTSIPCDTDLDCYKYESSACLDATLALERILYAHLSSNLSLCTETKIIDLNLEVLPLYKIELNELGFTSFPCHTDSDCLEFVHTGKCLDATLEIESIFHAHLLSHLKLCRAPERIDVDVALKVLPQIQMELNLLLFTSIPCHTDLDCYEYESSACLDATLAIELVLYVHLSSHLSLCTETQIIDLNLEVLPSYEIELNELGFTSFPCHTHLDCYEYKSSECLDATLEIEYLLHVHISSHLPLCTYHS